jgi:hypothetical protein
MEGKARIVEYPLSAELQPASLADLPTKDDYVGFEPYVKALHRFLTNEQTHGPLTISIEGEWGIGKSSFMEQLADALCPRSGENSKHIIVRFNAWRHERADELWASFALEFIRKVTKNLTQWERWKGHAKLIRYRFKWGRGWPDVVRAVTWLGIATVILAGSVQGIAWLNDAASKLIARVGILAMATGAVLKAVTWIAQHIGNPLKLDLKEHVKSPEYEQKISFLEQFHEDFAKILKAYVGDRRVYVFVDDLDRCEIPKAAELMQALNLMLSSDNELFFLLGMDRQKVAAGIALKHALLLPYLRAGEPGEAARNTDLAWYGVQFGYEFIEKFIQIPFVIPQPTEDGIMNYIRSLSIRDSNGKVPSLPSEVEGRREMFRLSVTERDSEEILNIVARVAPALGNNPRRVKLFLNLFRLRLLTAVETGLLDEGGGLTPKERVRMNLRVDPMSDQENLTLDQLGTFVALSLRWPLLLAEAAENALLIKALENEQSSVPDRWMGEPQLLEFLSGNQNGKLGEVDIRRLLRALPQVRTVGRTFQLEFNASSAPAAASITAEASVVPGKEARPSLQRKLSREKEASPPPRKKK